MDGYIVCGGKNDRFGCGKSRADADLADLDADQQA